jgi:hypothetical protein
MAKFLLQYNASCHQASCSLTALDAPWRTQARLHPLSSAGSCYDWSLLAKCRTEFQPENLPWRQPSQSSTGQTTNDNYLRVPAKGQISCNVVMLGLVARLFVDDVFLDETPYLGLPFKTA